MPAQHRRLQITRTAHLYQLGDLSAATRHLWIVCHGYGQLAKYFIRHFEVLADPETVVIAPEGLSKFYLQGFSGRVGAAWMTKEERLADIEDYVGYLNQVLEDALQMAPSAEVHVLGFSQGAATVCRWLAQLQKPVKELVLWAGIFPEDLNLSQAQKMLLNVKLTYVYGLQDSFISPDQVQEQLDRMHQMGFTPDVLTFTGEHTLNAAVLHQLKDS